MKSSSFLPTPSYDEVVKANVTVFDTLAASYNETEPHFSPENKARVSEVLRQTILEAGATPGATRMLDVGCGTGFMIDLGRPMSREIHGVDISPQMLSRVRLDGPCNIVLHQAETGSMNVPENYFDVATAYSFLHHLKDIRPTLAGMHKALRPGGKIYIDLEPNGYFLRDVAALDRSKSYDIVVQREIEQVGDKDEEIAQKLKVPTGTFQSAEFGKSLQGGFIEEDLVQLLEAIGYKEIQIRYNWFLGQGVLINDASIPADQRKLIATATGRVLQRALPVSRRLFKYLSIHAAK